MAQRGGPAAGRPSVLESFGAPRATTNPHLVLLLEELRRLTEVATFSWRAALLGRYDVLHLHWPEVVVTKSSRWRTWLACLTFALVLVRARVTRVAVVRTVHNLAPHERPTWPVRAVLAATDRATSAWILLNRHTPAPTPRPATVVPLGDYGTWYGAPRPLPDTPTMASVGLVRRYKDVPGLLHAFHDVQVPGARLVVAGAVPDAGLAAQVRAAAGDDPRCDLHLTHLDDADLAAVVAGARVVALPYAQMHNSGAALLALTLHRPVLVPSTPVTEDLAAEVGEAWVHRFTGPLDAAALTAALTAAAPDAPPDLSGRSWEVLARRHLEVFADAVGRLRGAPGRPSNP